MERKRAEIARRSGGFRGKASDQTHSFAGLCHMNASLRQNEWVRSGLCADEIIFFIATCITGLTNKSICGLDGLVTSNFSTELKSGNTPVIMTVVGSGDDGTPMKMFPTLEHLILTVWARRLWSRRRRRRRAQVLYGRHRRQMNTGYGMNHHVNKWWWPSDSRRPGEGGQGYVWIPSDLTELETTPANFRLVSLP